MLPLLFPETSSRWLGRDTKDDCIHTEISTLKIEFMSDDLPDPLCYEDLQSIGVRFS